MEKLPETMEKMSQTMEKILQVMEKLTQTMEKPSETVEVLPQTMENMDQTTGKVRQTLEILTPITENLKLQDKWMINTMIVNGEKNGVDEAIRLSAHLKVELDGNLKSPILLAAERADLEVLRLVLETGKFDTQCQDQYGNTPLHAAVRCEGPVSLPAMLIDFVEIPKECPHGSRDLEQSSMTTPQQRESHHESRRQGCINLLLQEGLDIWETNKSGKIPDPGPKASPGYSLWWYERLARETLDQKTSFNVAGSAVSVTAALVATASYIGPLQPPLAYSWEDKDGVSKVQTGIIAVHVFFVLNTLAFYLAIAAVVLSFTPALPAPHESTHAELKRIRRSVLWALMLLIVSLIAILSAFASASIVVVSSAERWLTTAPVVVGCIICVVVLIFCCIRAAKLMSHKKSWLVGYIEKRRKKEEFKTTLGRSGKEDENFMSIETLNKLVGILTSNNLRQNKVSHSGGEFW
ncbi:hypothetical protein R1sor_000260 [Riccia sorocarpa]|uniref:PGG domain-containing protein n=1 Tax=Riccia sorocarpa TaxID=122646 RepID=A0ABD3GTF3_9MARC